MEREREKEVKRRTKKGERAGTIGYQMGLPTNGPRWKKRGYGFG